MEQALIILTVPAEFSDAAKAIMRECIYAANLIATKNSEKLQFSTERKLLLSKSISNSYLFTYLFRFNS